MDYKVIITPRKLCDAGMEALAAQANYEVVDKVNACNFLPELQKADALMIKEGGIGREDMLACPDLKVIARHGVALTRWMQRRRQNWASPLSLRRVQTRAPLPSTPSP